MDRRAFLQLLGIAPLARNLAILDGLIPKPVPAPERLTLPAPTSLAGRYIRVDVTGAASAPTQTLYVHYQADAQL